MYVCICHGVTEKDIQKAASEGASSLQDIKVMTGCATGCGTCAESAIDVLQAHHKKKTPDFLKVFRSPANWKVPA